MNKEGWETIMRSTWQLENSKIKSPKRKQFVLRNQRIMDLMERHKKGALTLEEYFMKICDTIKSKQ